MKHMGGGREILGENLLSMPLCAVQIIWILAGSNQGLRIEKLPINRLRHCRALFQTEMCLH